MATKIDDDLLLEIKNTFTLRNEMIITDADCELLINRIRKKLGLKNFPKGHYQKHFMPKPQVKHNGQYHTVEVNVPEGHSHEVDATQ